MYDLLFFVAIFCVDSLDFLAHKIHVVLEFLNLPVHLVNERIALFGAGVQETEVVFVGLYFLTDGVILPHEPCALVIQCVLSAFCHLLKVLFEVRQPAFGHADVQFFVEQVEHGVIFFVYLVLLFEWYMAYALILLDQFLHLFLQVFAFFFDDGFQLCDDLALLIQVLVFLATLSGSGCIAGFKELVAGS